MNYSWPVMYQTRMTELSLDLCRVTWLLLTYKSYYYELNYLMYLFLVLLMPYIISGPLDMVYAIPYIGIWIQATPVHLVPSRSRRERQSAVILKEEVCNNFGSSSVVVFNLSIQWGLTTFKINRISVTMQSSKYYRNKIVDRINFVESLCNII